MRYEIVLLDIDDTIFDFQAGNRNAVHALMTELGLDSPTVFDEYQAINHACWAALERGEMTQEVLHVERFRRFLRSKGREDDPVTVAGRFAELLGQQAILMDGALTLLEGLAARMKIVLLTNGITVIQRARLEKSGILRFVSKTVISQEVGVSKPDPKIFELALGDVSPRQALMIGDGIESDVKGANLAGLDVCWLNTKGKTLPEGLHAEYEVSKLTDCLTIALTDLPHP